MSSIEPSAIEPWLRGDKTDVPAVGRAVLHALQLAEEDLQKWCGNLSDAELNARPAGTAIRGISYSPSGAEPGSSADVCRGATVECRAVSSFGNTNSIRAQRTMLFLLNLVQL